MSAAIEREAYQDYSPERKAEVLALVEANAGNVLQTSRETGIHHATIRYWQENSHRFSEIQKRKQEDLATRYEHLAHITLDNWEAKVPDASLAQLATASAIATDKMLLLRGQPTSIVETVDRTEISVVLESILGEVQQ